MKIRMQFRNFELPETPRDLLHCGEMLKESGIKVGQSVIVVRHTTEQEDRTLWNDAWVNDMFTFEEDHKIHIVTSVEEYKVRCDNHRNYPHFVLMRISQTEIDAMES
jgi:hypothetical protein